MKQKQNEANLWLSPKLWSWSNPVVRSAVWQLALACGLIFGVSYLLFNVSVNLEERDIEFGYGFLSTPTGFDIAETLVDYDSTNNYYLALLAGFLNTLRVALFGIFLASILGLMVGIGALSRNPLLARLCRAYVEIFRNIPLLIQLSMWYFVVLVTLPNATNPIEIAPNAFLSKGGMNVPWPVSPSLWLLSVFGLFAGIGLSIWWLKRQTKKTQISGNIHSAWQGMTGFIIGMPLIGWMLSGAPTEFEFPTQSRFGIEAGAALSPEFLALLAGLTLYTASFIAEVIRAGILAVPKGQSEAANALGLSATYRLRFVILPQAMRVIIPPLTNQYLNLTKNSSLAVAIGYPDLVGIATTTLNQTGRSIEAISILMLIYLSISLSTSAFMQWFERKTAIKER